MIDTTILFPVFLAAGILSAFAVYAEDTIFKSAIALAITFTVISLALLLINQTLVAVLQLLVIVGGISTYLVVAVASETRKKAWSTDMRVLATVSILTVAALLYLAIPYLQNLNVSNTNIYLEFQQALQQYLVIIYFLAVLMFAAAIGSVIVIKMGLKK